MTAITKHRKFFMPQYRAFSFSYSCYVHSHRSRSQQEKTLASLQLQFILNQKLFKPTFKPEAKQPPSNEAKWLLINERETRFELATLSLGS